MTSYFAKYLIKEALSSGKSRLKLTTDENGIIVSNKDKDKDTSPSKPAIQAPKLDPALSLLFNAKERYRRLFAPKPPIPKFGDPVPEQNVYGPLTEAETAADEDYKRTSKNIDKALELNNKEYKAIRDDYADYHAPKERYPGFDAFKQIGSSALAFDGNGIQDGAEHLYDKDGMLGLGNTVYGEAAFSLLNPRAYSRTDSFKPTLQKELYDIGWSLPGTGVNFLLRGLPIGEAIMSPYYLAATTTGHLTQDLGQALAANRWENYYADRFKKNNDEAQVLQKLKRDAKEMRDRTFFMEENYPLSPIDAFYLKHMSAPSPLYPLQLMRR